MDKKLFTLVLAIAFLMLTTPVFASVTTTSLYVGKGAFAMNLVDQAGNYLFIFVFTSKGFETDKFETFVSVAEYDSNFNTIWSAVKDLSNKEFTWGMGQAMLSTTVDFFGAPAILTAEWQAIAPPTKTHISGFSDPIFHDVYTGLVVDASATATLNGLNFYYVPSLSPSVWLGLDVDVTIT